MWCPKLFYPIVNFGFRILAAGRTSPTCCLSQIFFNHVVKIRISFPAGTFLATLLKSVNKDVSV